MQRSIPEPGNAAIPGASRPAIRHPGCGVSTAAVIPRGSPCAGIARGIAEAAAAAAVIWLVILRLRLCRRLLLNPALRSCAAAFLQRPVLPRARRLGIQRLLALRLSPLMRRRRRLRPVTVSGLLHRPGIVRTGGGKLRLLSRITVSRLLLGIRRLLLVGLLLGMLGLLLGVLLGMLLRLPKTNDWNLW